MAEEIEIPDRWTVALEHEDAEKDDSIVLTHEAADFMLEAWRQPDDVAPDHVENPSIYGPGKWDVEYVDPDGVRRDGASQYHDSAQDAIEDCASWIREVRCEYREKAEQVAEMEAVEWPNQIGRFHLAPSSSKSKAVYETRYIHSKSILGVQHSDETLEIKLYEDTRNYHLRHKQGGFPNRQGDDFSRKQSAIDAAEEVLKERTEVLNDREEQAVEEHDIPDHHIPERLKDSVDTESSAVVAGD